MRAPTQNHDPRLETMQPPIAHIICMPLNNNIKLSAQSVKLDDRGASPFAAKTGQC